MLLATNTSFTKRRVTICDVFVLFPKKSLAKLYISHVKMTKLAKMEKKFAWTELRLLQVDRVSQRSRAAVNENKFEVILDERVKFGAVKNMGRLLFLL